MMFPFPVPVFLSAGADGYDAGYEVHLNRSGINSIDTPREKITAESGSSLRIRFLNHGAPIHITITSSNAGMFTDFFHENLYVVDESVLTIPIRKDSLEEAFDLEILSGYGVVKTQMQVHVIHPPAVRLSIQEEYPLQPVAHGRPHLLMIMMGIALLIYCAWLYTHIEFLNIASFIILIVGALYTWYRQQ
ncbi:MAG: hypothetical protein ABSG49_01080 [Methanoregula sp.]|jgi:hypothetical protein|uniref:DUF7524 family protein n=1 Tax=Methanoregula sp. TaxID=2052170 RepID=UPI003C29341F